MTTPNHIQDFLTALRPNIDGDLRTGLYDRTLYSTDASIYQVMPYGVLIPKTMDDVHAAVELAAKYKVPVLGRTGGSSLAGQVVNEALIMDMTPHLNTVIELNVEEKWVRVQPGIVLDELNFYLRPYGLQFGPDPASSNRAAMGGIVSNNSTGSHSIKYGMTADHVLETDIILSDGSLTHFAACSLEQLSQFQQKSGLEGKVYRDIFQLAAKNVDIIRAGTPRHWRRCGGYNLDRFINEGVSFHYPQDHRFNLAKLICGAEGTLGIMTEIKLNLVSIPKKTALAIVHFDSLKTALDAVPTMLEVDPSAIELLDNIGLTSCRQVPKYARLLKHFVDGEPNCILITEFYGETDSELQHKLQNLEQHLRSQGINTTAIINITDSQRQKDVWTVRKVGLGFLMGIKGDFKPIPIIEDAAVPPEHLSEYVMKVEEYCHSIGTKVAYYAHASAGCLHIRPLVNTKAAKEIAKMPDIVAFSVELLKGYGGSLSSEHGDGRARSWINERFFGQDLYQLYQQVKHIFDPHNIFNPNNVVNALPMTENLRYGEIYEVIPLTTYLDFSADQGFHRAIEMCNGAGVCRKNTTGTMCPSFMVTREEEHSTRGRANMLRAAMSGLIATDELTSERMHGVMDLCISCKACKSECPSSVDMAKIKTEFLAQYYEKNGMPLRAKLLANIHRLSVLSSGWRAPLANWSLKNGLIRWGLEKFVGISRNRPMPMFARQSFAKWFKKRLHKSSSRQIVLFHDTFNNYHHPEIAIAATQLFEAAGFEILLPNHRCCGRPMFSKGLVKGARKYAQGTVESLLPFAEKGLPIVGLEPSCILMLRDEYFSLLPDNSHVKTVADCIYTFEEYLAKLIDEDVLNLKFTEDARKLLLHGHCHQKAMVGTVPSHKVLNLPLNYEVNEVDSSCCGMAGSFGFEAEHYDISMQMAERRLLPAVRDTDNDTILVAAGVSCRQQIEHGSGKIALHPAQVLVDALEK